MGRLRWLGLSLFLLLGTLFAVRWLAAMSTSRGIDVEETKALLACMQLASASEAFRDHTANRGHQLPIRVGDLIHPPWGGPPLIPDIAEEPRDPWGNPFQMEHRRKPDGTPFLVVWTAKPDGTRISQFGIGQSAEPR